MKPAVFAGTSMPRKASSSERFPLATSFLLKLPSAEILPELIGAVNGVPSKRWKNPITVPVVLTSIELVSKSIAVSDLAHKTVLAVGNSISCQLSVGMASTIVNGQLSGCSNGTAVVRLSREDTSVPEPANRVIETRRND